jgi:hypothetical protein
MNLLTTTYFRSEEVRILTKFKDFYDFYGHVISPDSKDDVIYDRRECVRITDDTILKRITGEWRKPLYGWRIDSKGYPFVLEVGYVQYFLRAIDVERRDVTPPPAKELDIVLTGCFIIDHVRRENRHVYPAPMTLHEYLRHWRGLRPTFDQEKRAKIKDCKWSEIDWNYPVKRSNWYVNPWFNPILCDTSLTKVLDPKEIWVNLDQYLSSLRNESKVESEGLTDKDKVVNHGMDPKESFRGVRW